MLESVQDEDEGAGAELELAPLTTSRGTDGFDAFDDALAPVELCRWGRYSAR